MKNLEFVVWGIPPGNADEVPLFTKAKSRLGAEKVAKCLEATKGCRKTRVQTFEISEEGLGELTRTFQGRRNKSS